MALDFNLKVTINAPSHEEAIAQVINHLTTVARNVGSGRDLADCGALFTISDAKANAKASDLRVDVAKEKHGAIDLDLDPASSQGKAVAAQKVEQAAEAEREAARKAQGAKDDEEILAEIRAKARAEHTAAMAERETGG